MDLTKVDATNKALQADTKAAKTVRAAHQAVVDALHSQVVVVPPVVVPPPVVAPASPGQHGEHYLDIRPNSGHLVLGEAPSGTANANSGFAGPNLNRVSAKARGYDTLPNWDDWLELALNPGEAVPGGGRYMISAMGMDPAEPGYPGGHPSANTPEGYFNGAAWHHHAQDYTYVTPFRIPKAGYDMIGSSMICTVCEIAHADAVIDGAWPTSFYPTTYHGHNATGLLLAANRPGLVQQFTPRPGDGFVPAITDTTPYWAFKMGYGDVTNHDNIATWVIEPVVPDVTTWFAMRLVKQDGPTGLVQTWTQTKGRALTQRINYTGPTNQHVAGTAPFDPKNPRSNASDNPQRLMQHSCFTLGPMIYNGSVNPPVTFKIQSGGIVRFPSVIDAHALLRTAA